MLIDQTNEKEKAAQIPLMRYIYQQASRVIIWLDVKGEEAAASMVVRASRWAEQKSRQSTISSDASNLSLAHAFALENPDVVWRAPFHNIVGLSWFKRIWFVQEATLAGQLVVQLGGEEIA
ncbi:hypothetical protein EJ08DRAFT_699950 [Tothia fuscella]|uniref:Heterokaryon incompatibility domain-containing protein n=1 Tax=Tothia fuscella TaxID=1048955 RepID=A0A9P4NLP0_9PEZI|nr:hypothetical protein EJ08DRAFT_699950 [Tothia fuscella]